MLIQNKLLLKYGASIQKFSESEIIFKEGDKAAYYYQIHEGIVKHNYVSRNNETILNILIAGENVCDFLALTDEKFPVNAVAIVDTSIIRISKKKLIELVRVNTHISDTINNYLAERVYRNHMWMRKISARSAEERIFGLLKYFKEFYNSKQDFPYQIPFTRAQLASMTGLRVETVIKTIKKMEKMNTLQIKSGKIYL